MQVGTKVVLRGTIEKCESGFCTVALQQNPKITIQVSTTLVERAPTPSGERTRPRPAPAAPVPAPAAPAAPAARDSAWDSDSEYNDSGYESGLGQQGGDRELVDAWLAEDHLQAPETLRF